MLLGLPMAQCTVHWAEPDENRTLRHFALTNYPKGMPESMIHFTLKEILKGIHHLQAMFGREPEVDSGRVCVYTVDLADYPIHFKVAYDEERMRMVGPAINPGVGRWAAGIVALELAYGSGSLPENMTSQQLLTLGDNMVRILRQKMAGSFKKKIKNLPNSLEMLLDDWYVNRREQKLIAKRNARGIMRAIKIVESSVRSLPLMDTHQKRSFSWNFLQVVMRCLDREHPPPIPELLRFPFLRFQ